MVGETFPFKPGDWVADGSERIAKVKDVYAGRPGEVLLDLAMYDWSGERVGRLSPAMGGPRTYEPACSADGWGRISPPDFPIKFVWVQDGDRITGKYWAGPRLPPLQWRKRQKTYRGRAISDPPAAIAALRQIADGHNDARTLAANVLDGIRHNADNPSPPDSAA